MNGFSKKIFLWAKCAILGPKMIIRIFLNIGQWKGQRVSWKLCYQFFKKKKKKIFWCKLSTLGPKMIYPCNSGYPLSGRKLFPYNVILRSKKGRTVMILNVFSHYQDPNRTQNFFPSFPHFPDSIGEMEVE